MNCHLWEYRRFYYKKIVPIEADLGDDKSYDKLSERLERDKPHVKVLINNAGYVKTGMFSDMKKEDILNRISVNVKGMTMIQKTFLPYMEKGSFTFITCSLSDGLQRY